MSVKPSGAALGGGAAVGSAVSSGTAGSVLFVGAGGLLAQDNTNLYWDDTNKALGIGTGAVSGKSLLSATVALAVHPDADRVAIFGRVRLHSYASDYAMFGHYDQSASYALAHTTAGFTIVNSVNNGISMAIAGSAKWRLNGSTYAWEPLGDNTTDLGASATYRVRNLFAAGYWEGSEMAAPAAPAANKARVYFEDNGAGKTRLVVLFPTGAAQVIATEP